MKTHIFSAIILAAITSLFMLPASVQAQGFEHRDRMSHWLLVELQDDIELEQFGWGAAANHRTDQFTVEVVKNIRGKHPAKLGRRIKIEINLHLSTLPDKLANGKKGDILFLGCDSPEKELTVSNWDDNILCHIDTQRESLLEKEKELPIGWKYQDNQLHSYWMSCASRTPDPQFFEPSNIQKTCPETGMPAYTSGDAEVSIKLIIPPKEYFDFKQHQKDAEQLLYHGNDLHRLRPHIASITVTNRDNAPITVPAIRTLGGKILWHNSVQVIVTNDRYTTHPHKQFLRRAKLTDKTEALRLEPGQSVTGEVDLTLLEDSPKVSMYGWGSRSLTGVIVVGDVAKAFSGLELDPIAVWGAYNKYLPGVRPPFAGGKNPHENLDAKFQERFENYKRWAK